MIGDQVICPSRNLPPPFGNPKSMQVSLHFPTQSAAIWTVARKLEIDLPAAIKAGDLTPDEARAFAATLLPPADAEPPDGLAERWGPLAEPGPGPLDTELANQTQVVLTWAAHAPPWNHEDWAALTVANHILGGHFYSRLYVALRHEKGLAYGSGAHMFSSGDQEGQMRIGTSTKVATAAEARAVVEGVMATFAADGITAEELDDAKGYLLGREAFRYQHPGAVLNQRLGEMDWGLEPGWRERHLARVDARTVGTLLERYPEVGEIRSAIHAITAASFRDHVGTLGDSAASRDVLAVAGWA